MYAFGSWVHDPRPLIWSVLLPTWRATFTPTLSSAGSPGARRVGLCAAATDAITSAPHAATPIVLARVIISSSGTNAAGAAPVALLPDSMPDVSEFPGGRLRPRFH